MWLRSTYSGNTISNLPLRPFCVGMVGLMQAFRVKIFGAVAFGFIFLTFWALSSPIGSSPDDDFHLASIWCEEINQSELCEVDSESLTATVPVGLAKGQHCFAANGYQSAICQKDSLALPNTEVFETPHGNWINLYPSGFYKVMSFMNSGDFVKSVLAMRLFNAALFLLMLFITYRAVELRVFHNYITALLPALIGLGYFLIPSTNPSSWAIMSCATFAISFSAFFMGFVRSKIFLFISIYLSLFMAISSRVDATVYIALTAVLIIIFSKFKVLTVTHYLITASVLLISMLRLLNGPKQTDTLINGGVGIENLTRPESVTLWINLQNLPSILIGGFGYWPLGWFDTAIPIVGWLTTSIIVSILLWMHIPFMDYRTQSRAILGFAFLCVIPMWIMSRGNNIVGEAVQPRYIYPFLLAMIALVVSNLNDLKISKSQRNLMIFLISVAQSVVLHAQLRRYLTGQDVSGINLNRNIEWWWSDSFLSPNMVWILGSLSFMATVILAYHVSESRTNSRT